MFKASWELEGGARLAEQLVAYRLFGHGSGREMGFAEYSTGATWYSEWLREMALFFGWDPRGGRLRPNPGGARRVQLGRQTPGRQFRAVPTAGP